MQNILLTKLFIPKIKPELIKHKFLIDKIEAGIEKSNKITLISAPAGYGKTTLVLEFINSKKHNYSWISLDDDDNDLNRYLAYFITALKNKGIKFGSDLENLLFEPQLAIVDSVLSLLINYISQSSEKIVLVLDDYHSINTGSIHEAMNFIIEHQPPNLHIIMTSREDPPFPLPKLRVRSQITEIRVDDLRFTINEAEEFFNTMGINLKKEEVKIINTRTEGWAAGLQLACLSLKGHKEQDIGNFVEGFCGSNRYIIDYLVEEVLQSQNNEIRSFLIKTSILDKMNPELCDSIAGRNDSKNILHELEQSNLFIIPLDEKREWFRYHHLFADSLRTELNFEDKQILYKKAANWHETNKLKADGVKYAFKSKDMLLTIKLIENCLEDMFKNAELPTLVKWLDALPKELVRSNEILSIRAAWALYITGNISGAIEYLNSLDENIMNNITPHNKGLLLSLQALLIMYTKNGGSLQPDENVVKLSSEALELIEDWDPMARIATMNTLGGSLSDSGRTAEACETYKNAFNEGLKLGYTFITALSLLYYTTSLNILGKRLEAIKVCEAFINRMSEKFGSPLPFSGLIYINLGGLYYEGYELKKAREYVLKGIDLSKNMSLNWISHGDVWLAKIMYAVGDRQNAINAINDACINALKDKLPRKVLKIKETLIELLLREGNTDTAMKEAADWNITIDRGPIPVFEYAYLLYIRILLSYNKADEALRLLEKVEEPVRSGQRIRLLINVNLLYSKIYYLKNEKVKAYDFMVNALKLAERQGYIIPFIDNSDEIAVRLLTEMKNSSGDFGERLLSLTQNKYAASDDVLSNDVLIDKLSEREMDLLILIANGLTNNEISKKLYISINTTQWHISNIYSKLGVRNRTQAILKARELKLL